VLLEKPDRAGGIGSVCTDIASGHNLVSTACLNIFKHATQRGRESVDVRQNSNFHLGLSFLTIGKLRGVLIAPMNDQQERS
jgi:hypothetical protein